jgi:hypothetical protein
MQNFRLTKIDGKPVDIPTEIPTIIDGDAIWARLKASTFFNPRFAYELTSPSGRVMDIDAYGWCWLEKGKTHAAERRER